MLDGELQGRSEVSGGEEDRTSEVRDVQSAVSGTGNAVGGQAQGRGRTGVRQQRQDVPLVVSHVRGRVRHRAGDRDQSVGPVRTGQRDHGYAVLMYYFDTPAAISVA